MKKTKHFNISVPELGDVPDITQVSNAISDLEDATAGTLEIMKAEMQGTKITLTSVSRKTKRTGYYEGMSIRFKSPQDIEPNYLKTISVDDLGDQTLSVEYKVNRNEYIDIVYEGNKFTAYPVVVQKTDSVSNNSSVLVGTAKGVKTAYDKASNAERIANTKEPIINKKTGFNLDKSDSVTSNSSSTLATSAAVMTAYDKGVEALNKATQAQSSANNAQSTADEKVSKNGDTMTGTLNFNYNKQKFSIGTNEWGGVIGGVTSSQYLELSKSGNITIKTPKDITLISESGETVISAKNLTTSKKEVVSAINENMDNINVLITGSKSVPTTIQRPGTKSAGLVYSDEYTGKMFMCVNTTTTQLNNSDDFVDLTMKALYNKNKWTHAKTLTTKGEQYVVNKKYTEVRIISSNLGSIIDDTNNESFSEYGSYVFGADENYKGYFVGTYGQSKFKFANRTVTLISNEDGDEFLEIFVR